MPSDHEVALAFIARRQAKRAMTASGWSHMLSLEMGWMNPGQARAFVEGAVRSGILAKDGDGDELRLVIDPQAVEVPRGFRPQPDAQATSTSPPASGPGAAAHAVEPDLFLSWVARLAAHRRLTREQVLGQVAALQESLGGHLTAEAAILLLARRSGLDVAEAARGAAAAMLKPSRAGTPAPGRAGSR
jgi:hypothetical protein